MKGHARIIVPIRRALAKLAGYLWNTMTLGLALVLAFHIGRNAGYGQGAREVARLMIEMRQGGYSINEPWDRGGI